MGTYDFNLSHPKKTLANIMEQILVLWEENLSESSPPAMSNSSLELPVSPMS